MTNTVRRASFPIATAAVLLIATSSPVLGAGEQHPFPQHVAYAPGTIRPNHQTAAQQDDAVRAYYDQWKAEYLTTENTADPSHWRVRFGKTAPNRDITVSEGQGFGMIVVALMAGHDAEAQDIFDGLWSFVRANPSNIDPRLMGFKVPPDVPGVTDSAFDGDCDIAYGLLLADAQWGSAGAVDYAGDAGTLITAILESTIGPVSRLPMLGDWTDPGGKKFNEYTPRSSDFILDHFRAFERAIGDPVWAEVVSASQDVIDALQARYTRNRQLDLNTGLLPDFIKVSPTTLLPKPARGGFLEGRFDGRYYYNAVRDPWRLGTDALLNDDARSLAATRLIATWSNLAAGGDPASIKGGYRLNGKPLPGSDYFSIVFAAPFGVAAMTDPAQQAWLNAIYDAVSTTHEEYYEDSVTLLSLLVMTGNYWDPTTIGP
jgi:hypothetical protein